MTPFTKILVAHDFSEHSKRAIEVASDLARRYETPLTLVHVLEPMVFVAPDELGLSAPIDTAPLRAALNKRLREMAEWVRSLGVTQADAQVRDGAPVHEITRLAEDGGYDLIVMGTHGRTGFRRALIGSVAERVVRTAHCPVLTTR